MRRRYAMLAAGLASVAVAVAGVTVAALVLGASEDAAAYRGSRPPEGMTLPAFTLPTHAGEIVAADDLSGKVVILTFLDAQCTEACPIIAFQIAGAIDRLTRDERAGLSAVAISTDPEEDTRGAVQRFLEKNRAVGKLRYLVAPVERLRPVWEDFQIAPSLDTGSDTLHSAPVRIYDREGVWVSTLHAGADLTMENLAHDLRVALGEG